MASELAASGAGDADAPAAFEAWVEATRGWVDAELQRVLPAPEAVPARLHEALAYAVFGGGKRLRPALLRCVGRSLGADDAPLAAPAAAVELVHTYSLVHDDLPCMDDDELRRGQPTVHVRYGEATAVLVGDALLTAAFGALASPGPLGDGAARACAAVLAAAAGSRGMVGGQALDLDATGGAPDLDGVRRVHALKTAAMLEAAAEMGALAAGAGSDTRHAVRDYGRALGMLFQAVDDVLDVTGDAATLGKTPGKDAAQEKVTLVAAVGLVGARAEAAGRAEEARAAARRLGWEPEDPPWALIELLAARSA